MKKIYLRSLVILVLLITLLSGCSTKTAGGYYKEGVKNFKSGNYTEAETNFSNAIAKNGEKAEYYINYGMTLTMLGKYEDALSNFDKAILDKDNSIVNKNNKLAYRGKGITYLKSFQYKEAVNQFDKALAISELTNLNLDILYYKANAEEKAGLNEEAEQTYTKILKTDNKNAVVYAGRAAIYGKLKDYEKSLADYDKAISLDKKNYNYYLGKYFIQMESKDKNGATQVLETAAALEAKSQSDKYGLAKIHYYMEDYEKALPELEESIKNGFTGGYFYIGGIYEIKGDYQSAIKKYKSFIEDNTTEKTAEVYNQIGYCLIESGQYEDALSYIKTGLEYQDADFDKSLKHNEIVSYEKLGNFAAAYKQMTQYISQYPKEEDATKEYEFIKTRLPKASIVKDTKSE